MNMTHYMELLAVNQPWNLILFMAIPVILAETVAITELYLLYTRRMDTWVRTLNRGAGIGVGLYFIGVIAYLLATAVVPITQAGQWRTVLDVIAVGAYLLGGLPMVAIAFLELGLLHRGTTAEQKMGWHAVYVSAFLVLAHIAMIAGMADPSLLGYQGEGHGAHMPAEEVLTAPMDHSSHH